MAEFIAFEEGIKVNGQTVLSVVNAISIGQDTRLKILKKHGIDPIVDKWYDQQKWLDAFKEISMVLGEKTLFSIGKAIPANAKFPPEIDNLEKALSGIDIAYHMNHTKGNIGHYTLTEFNLENKQAIMVCNNPYPSEFDRGIITQMLRLYKPKDAFTTDVELDTTKESRKKGGDSCTYLINWNTDFI